MKQRARLIKVEENTLITHKKNSITLINVFQKKMIKDSQKCQMCPDQSPGKFPSFIYPSGDVDLSKLPQIAPPLLPR